MAVTTPAPVGPNRFDRIVATLRAHGERVTSARTAVLRVLARLRPPRAPDGGGHRRRGAAVDPGLHRATVYRTLDLLADLGVVEHVHVAHGAVVYHLTEERHQHLVCESCGAVIEAPVETLDELGPGSSTIRVPARAGHFPLTGLCARCADPAASGAPTATTTTTSTTTIEVAGAKRCERHPLPPREARRYVRTRCDTLASGPLDVGAAPVRRRQGTTPPRNGESGGKGTRCTFRTAISAPRPVGVFGAAMVPVWATAARRVRKVVKTRLRAAARARLRVLLPRDDVQRSDPGRHDRARGGGRPRRVPARSVGGRDRGQHRAAHPGAVLR